MSNLFAAFAQHALAKPHAIALQGDGVCLTYGELLVAVSERELLLNKAGVNVLGLPLANSVEWILWDLAALNTGRTCVPLPPFFTAEQVTHVIACAGIDAYVHGNQLITLLSQNNASIPVGTVKITYTSGSTGTPKGVCLSAIGMEQLAQSLLTVIGAEYGQRHLSVMPLAILLENIAGVYTALMAGSEVYIPSPETIGMGNPFRPDFMQLVDYIAQHAITSIILTPELLAGLVRAVHENPEGCASLRFVAVGGATVPPALLTAARDVGLPVYEGYGLSECASVVALNTPASNHEGTVGNILPHLKVEVRDGEVVVHNFAFLGYLGEPPRSPAEWFATGDNGILDTHGVLSISGRRKNTIITTQGRNIAPEWVESLLLSQPEIAQAFVYGDDLPFPQVLLVPAAESIFLAEAMKRTNHVLPVYAQLVRFDVVPPFTLQNGMLTATGRMRRNHIAQIYQHIMKGVTHHDILQ
jgi:long-chain acyl-CoA synthetase